MMTGMSNSWMNTRCWCEVIMASWMQCLLKLIFCRHLMHDEMSRRNVNLFGIHINLHEWESSESQVSHKSSQQERTCRQHVQKWKKANLKMDQHRNSCPFAESWNKCSFVFVQSSLTNAVYQDVELSFFQDHNGCSIIWPSSFSWRDMCIDFKV